MTIRSSRIRAPLCADKEELDQEKLTPLLRLKYQDSIADAILELGRPEEIGQMFSGFQRHLYAEKRL